MDTTADTINIMIDLETLGTKPGCKILTIGACTFGVEDTEDRYLFYKQLSWRQQYKLTESADTLAWWGKQSIESRHENFFGDWQINEALSLLSSWIESVRTIKPTRSNLKIWGNAASFDLKILEAAYIAYKREVPWGYRDEMCYRTLAAEYKGLVPNMPEFKGMKHRAIDDAVYQAECAEAMWKWRAELISYGKQYFPSTISAGLNLL